MCSKEITNSFEEKDPARRNKSPSPRDDLG